MKCNWLDKRDSDGRRMGVECRRCGYRVKTPGDFPLAKIHRNCHAWPASHEWGHWLTLILAACWIRKADYLRLKRLLGLTPRCGCDQRATWLNRVGAWVYNPLRRLGL